MLVHGRLSRSRALAVFVCAVSLVTACGSGGSDAGDSSAGAGSDETIAASDGASDSSDGASDSSADASGLDELVSAAQAEGGPLVWYTGVGEGGHSALSAAFTEKYGIDVEVVRLATGPLMERFGAEVDAGATQADIVEPASPAPFVDQPEWFADISDLPGHDVYPDKFKTDKTIVTSVSSYVVTYNTDLVSEDEVPSTWEELADPKWKGKILLSDPRSTPSWMGWAWRVYETEGIELLERIGAQDLDLSESASAGAAQIAAGAKELSVPAAPGNSADLRAQGAPVGMKLILENTSGPAISMGIAADAPHPATARLFAAFRMTAEAAELQCAADGSSTPNPAAEGCSELPESWVPINYDLTVEDQAMLLEALGVTGN